MKNRKFWISLIALILVGVMVLSLVAGLVSGDANAATSSSVLKEQLEALQGEKDAISDQIDALEEQQSSNFSDMEGILAQKGIIDQQVALLYTEINNINSQIATYSLLISDKQAELDEAEARLAELSEQNKERIRAMEEEGELSLWSVIFEANSFSDLLDRIEMVNEIAKADERRLQEMSQVAEEVAQAKAELTDEKDALEQTKLELEESQVELEAKTAEADALLAALVDQAEDLEALHQQFEQEEEDFLQQIADAEKAYNDAVAAEEESSRQASIQASREASIQESIQESIEESRRQEEAAKNTTKATSATAGNNGGGSAGDKNNPSGVIWLVPCDYRRVSSPFGYRWHPTTGKWSMHNGVDLTAPEGTPIYASRSGYVTIATYHSTAGNYVSINHQDGYSSVYMHMTHYVVSVGDYVKAGELIGYVGSTGRSTGNHLHFGISYNGSYVNPMDYIG